MDGWVEEVRPPTQTALLPPPPIRVTWHQVDTGIPLLRAPDEQKGQQEDFHTEGRKKTEGITSPSVSGEVDRGYKQKRVPLTNKFGYS